MDEFDYGGQGMVRGSAVAQSAGREQHQRRTQPFAAATDDVLGNLTDQHHVGMQLIADYPVHRLHIGGEQFLKLV